MPPNTIEQALIANDGALLAEVTRDEWSTPIPLASEAQRLPGGLLPGALGDFVESLSAHTETPRELAGLMCLAVTSASVAGRCEIGVREGYDEPLNLFVAVGLAARGRSPESSVSRKTGGSGARVECSVIGFI